MSEPMAERSHRLLLTVNEAAALLGIKRTKLYELLAAGVLPSVRIGSARRIPASAVGSYVDSLLRSEADSGQR